MAAITACISHVAHRAPEPCPVLATDSEACQTALQRIALLIALRQPSSAKPEFRQTVQQAALAKLTAHIQRLADAGTFRFSSACDQFEAAFAEEALAAAAAAETAVTSLYIDLLIEQEEAAPSRTAVVGLPATALLHTCEGSGLVSLLFLLEL